MVVDAVGYLPAASPYDAVGPERLLDTRETGLLSAQQRVEVQVTGRAGVPVGAQAAIINITAIRPAQPGFATVHPCLGTPPTASSLNYASGITRGNEIVAELDDAGKLCFFVSSSTHVSIDIVGSLPAGSAVTAVTPARLLDSRTSGSTFDGEFESIGRVRAGEVVELAVAGRVGIPVDASAVVVNITAVRPDTNGFVTVFPCGLDQPNASSLNYVAGVNGGNDLIAGLGDDGTLCVFTSATSDITLDVSAFIA